MEVPHRPLFVPPGMHEFKCGVNIVRVVNGVLGGGSDRDYVGNKEAGELHGELTQKSSPNSMLKAFLTSEELDHQKLTATDRIMTYKGNGVTIGGKDGVLVMGVK